ncbi:MAG: ABC transporter transmembrane domain-containing protein [Syntrophobacteraceae bacterium]
MLNRQTYKRLSDLVRPHWKLLGLSMICMMGVGLATAGAAYLIKPVLDDIFVNKDETMLKIMPIAVLVLVTSKGMFLWGNTYLTTYVGQLIIADLRRKLYDHIQNLPLSFFDNHATGDLMSRILNDVTFLQTTATNAVAGVMRECFSVIALLAVIFSRDWKLASIAVIILPIGFYPMIKLGKMLRRLGTSGQVSLADITISLHETIGGNRIVKAFGMEDYEKARFKVINDKNLKFATKVVGISALSSPIMEFFGGVVIVFTVWYGGWCVIHGVTTPGNFFSFIAGLLMLYEPVKRLNNTIGLIPVGVVAAERIFEIMAFPQEILNKDGAQHLPPIRRSIEFRNVNFSYGGSLVLKDINISAKAGELIALVGMSGAGKTTLVNLIPRLYEVTGGGILIDGVDIREVTLSSLRAQIGIVTQQSILFNDTVRNNIAYGDITSGEKDIIAAAKAANAYEFIMKMPQGLDTFIGEQGARLSGGERQRICIARALLKNAPILILDEATSSLDSESENEVQNALENLMAGRTTFVIAHRLSTIMGADRILALAEGEIVEEGHHDELLRKGGEYSRLYELQFAQLQGGMPDEQAYPAAKAV